MSFQFWLDVCSSSLSRPVEDQQKIAAASCGVTVAVFCLAAAVSGTMFLRWRRIDVNARRPLWKFYGWFCALSFLGNCFGIAVWVIWWKVLSLYFVVGNLQSMQSLGAELLWLTASYHRWVSAFLVLYAFEVLFLCVATLMVLDRMVDFAVPKEDVSRHRWDFGGRVITWVVFAGSVLGLLCNAASAILYAKAANFFSDSALAVAANSTNADIDILRQRANVIVDQGDHAAGLQEFCEVFVRLLMIGVFLFVGIVCANRVSSALTSIRLSDAAVGPDSRERGANLKRRIIITVFVTFFTTLLRTVEETMFALSNALQNDKHCANLKVGLCDGSCYNVFALIRRSIFFTPEVLLVIILISSPLTQLVAVWGMTNERTLQLMKSRGHQTAVAMRDNLLTGEA